MWLRTVDSLDHSMRLWCEPQSHASVAGLEAEAARLWTRHSVCNVCAACGTMLLFGCIYYIRTNGYYFYILK
jgi:hypothetical protein